MPLHDWTNRSGWEGVHHVWITELLRWVKPRLPSDYRAYIGTAPVLAVGAPAEKPDVGVRRCGDSPSDRPAPLPPETTEEPDEEIAVATLDPGKTLFVEFQGRLIAALELVSPRNKDRPMARATYAARYLGYLLEGVHLLLIDLHPRPVGFSFADQIAQELQLRQTPLPPPFAIGYRVGEPAATGGRILGIWHRPLTLDAPFPNMVLPLDVNLSIPVDLEQTYARAAADAYLS
jgi:hypothetical protein